MQAVLVRHMFALGFSFLIGIYIIPIIIKAAKKIGFMDAPDGKLKQHREPTPYLGGLAIYIAFITTLGLCFPFENQVLWLLLGTTLLLCVGLVDDLKVLKPNQKFFGQIIAVLCFLKGEFSLKTFYFSSFLNIALSAFWMLSIINAFNLVDVMDGLASLLALLAACTFGIIAFFAGDYTTSLLITSFVGAVGAFFVFNKPQAKIYLGDAGSLFIGGFLSVMPLLFTWDRTLFTWTNQYHYLFIVEPFIKPLFELFLIPCIILAIPILEICSLVCIRSWLGMPFYYGSPHHFSIYLQKAGWSRNRVLLFTVYMSLISSVSAVLFLNRIIQFKHLLAIACLFSCFWIYVIFMRSMQVMRNSIYGAKHSHDRSLLNQNKQDVLLK